VRSLKYEPVKNIIGTTVRSRPFLRKLLYATLGMMFLREWYVKRELKSLFARYPIRTMFDAGSGFGQYTYYCIRRFPLSSILAVDVKDDQIRDCTDFFQTLGYSNVEFRVENLLDPIHTNEFDLILSVDVMEHIRDDVSVFRNFARALRPGGFVLINTPSDMGGSDSESTGEGGFIDEHARTGYSKDEITAKLRSAGLTVELIRFSYGSWGMRAWRVGIKAPMLLLNRSKLWFLSLPVYYAIVLPFVLAMMAVDISMDNETGAGLLVLARKPG
jgi:SAM-dependent methyltransferase